MEQFFEDEVVEEIFKVFSQVGVWEKHEVTTCDLGTLCIFHSKVGVMLSLAARRAYEAANSRTKVLEGRYLAVHLRWSSRDDTGSIAVVATCFPTTVTAAERDANYMCIQDLVGFTTSRWTKQWLAVGDWNMHIGIDKTPDFKQRGPYGLAVPTTVAGTTPSNQ